MKSPRTPQRRDSAEVPDIRKLGKFTPFLDQVPFQYLLLDSSGIILEANLPAVQLLGNERGAILRLSMRDFVAENDREKFDRHMERCRCGEERVSTELRLEVSGTPVVEIVSSAFRPSRSQDVLLHTIIQEHPWNGSERSIERAKEGELQRLYRTLKALGKSGQAMMRAVDEATYMNDVCRIVQEDCGHVMVWIGFARDDEGKTITPVAYAGFDEGYLETLKLTWADTERGRGPTGSAVRTGQACLCRNMLTDPRFKPWREEAIKRGYAASIALPLRSGGKSFGAITIYSREPDPFSEEEVKLLDDLAGDLACGLTALRLRTASESAERSLRDSEERHRALFENMTEGFALHEIILDSHGRPCDYRFLDVNPSFERLTGLKHDDLVGKRVLEILPENEHVWIERYGKVALTGEAAHFENFSAPLNRWYEVFAYRPAPLQFAVIFSDITVRKQVEEAHREVEERVRRKLETVLMPEGDLGLLELGDLIDAPALQKLMDDFYSVARFPMSIVDMKGRVLVGVGWQEICTKFHRVNPETCKRCLESDTQLSAGVPQGEFRLYKCKNNLWDIATPIMVGGKQVGDIFSGQFFFDDEEIDRVFFRDQASQYGFDEEQYLAALDRVPRLSRATVDRGMAFLLKLSDMLSQLGYSNAKFARILAERDRLTASLHDEQERMKRAQEIAHLGSWELDLATDNLTWSDEVYRIFGVEPRQIAPTYEAFLEHVHPDDRAAVDGAYSESLRDGRDVYEIEHRVIQQTTGDIRFVHERCHHIRDNAGHPIRSVGMVHDITERKLAEKELKRSTREFALLSETAGALLAAVDPQTIVEELCRKVMAHLGCDVFFNFLVDEKAHRLRLNACAGIPAVEASKIQWLDFGVAVCGRVARDGRRIIVEDIQHTPDERTGLIKSFGVQAYCCHPLKSGDRVIGTLSFGSKQRPRFANAEIELMRAVTDQVAVAIERIRAEEALRRSEEWYRTLFSTMIEGFCTIEVVFDDAGKPVDYRFLEINPAFEVQTGLHDARGKFMRDLAPEHEAHWFEIYGKVALTGEPLRFENEAKALNRWYEVSAFRVGDAKDRKVAILFNDITQRKKAEEIQQRAHDELEIRVRERTAALKKTSAALEAERKRFIDVLDVLPAYVILLSPDYHVPFANRYFEERFGKSNGRRCYEYLFNRTEPCELCETFKTLKVNAPVKWEWTGPDGRIYDISDFPFTDTDGSKLILEMGIDVTERKRAEAELEQHRHHLEDLVKERTLQLSSANTQLHNEVAERKEAEQALQESEERFRLAIQHSKLMAWQCDTEMRFTWVYNSHFGASSDELLGKTPAELGNEKGMQEFVAHGAEVLARGMGTRKTIKHVHTDNRERYFDQQIEAVRDADGNIVGLIGISLDVTERVLGEQRLHKSEESFRLMVAHSVEPMLLVDETGRIDCISRKAAEQLGFQEGEILGVNIERFLDWSGKLDLTMRLEDFLRHAPLPARGVLRVKRSNGWSWIDVQASFVNYGQKPEKYLLKFELILMDAAT